MVHVSQLIQSKEGNAKDSRGTTMLQKWKKIAREVEDINDHPCMHFRPVGWKGTEDALKA